MLLRMFLLAISVCVMSVSGYAQTFAALLLSLDQMLTTTCAGSTPIPDGTIVKIYWDIDSDGPDATDPQPPEGTAFLEVNYNQFPMNGIAIGMGEGFFIPDNDFVSYGGMPTPSTYYLRICMPALTWTSGAFTLSPGPQEIYFGAVGGPQWTCTEVPCAGCGTPDSPTAVDATDNLCPHIIVTWTGSGTDIDSFRVLRDGTTQIASVVNNGAPSWTFMDATAEEGTHNYQVRSVRVCNDNSIELSPYAPTAPGTQGTRLNNPPIPQNVTATTTLCDTIRITFNVNSILGLDSLRLYRVGTATRLTALLPGTAGQTRTVNLLNETAGPHEYFVVGFSFTCGEGQHLPNVTGEDFDQPAAPTALTASTNSCLQITLNWTVGADADSVIIYRGPAANPTTPIGTVAASPATYNDTNAPAGPVQHYVLKAKNECGLSANSPDATGQRLSVLAPPQTVNATDNTCACVTVTWTHAGADSFIIFRTGTEIGFTLSGVLTYNDCTAQAGTVYAYSVRAVNQCGRGNASAANNGGILAPDNGTGTLANTTQAPNWNYTVTWTTGCITTVTFDSICLGTTATPPANWTVVVTPGANSATVVFTANVPVNSGPAITGFILNNANTECDTITEWHLGASDGTIRGPAETALSVVRGRALPTEYSLDVFPNPFNPTATLEFGLPQAGDVSIKVYNISGRLVADVVGGHHDAGWHKYSFNANDLSTGMYFARITSGHYVAIRKMMLLK